MTCECIYNKEIREDQASYYGCFPKYRKLRYTYGTKILRFSDFKVTLWLVLFWLPYFWIRRETLVILTFNENSILFKLQFRTTSQIIRYFPVDLHLTNMSISLHSNILVIKFTKVTCIIQWTWFFTTFIHDTLVLWKVLKCKKCLLYISNFPNKLCFLLSKSLNLYAVLEYTKILL